MIEVAIFGVGVVVSCLVGVALLQIGGLERELVAELQRERAESGRSPVAFKGGDAVNRAA
jgi:hypothetical protein